MTIYFLFRKGKYVSKGCLENLADYIKQKERKASRDVIINRLENMAKGNYSKYSKNKGINGYLISDNVLNPYALTDRKFGSILYGENWAVPLKTKGVVLALPFHYQFLLGYLLTLKKVLPLKCKKTPMVDFDICMSYFQDYNTGLRYAGGNSSSNSRGMIKSVLNCYANIKNINFDIDYSNENCYSCKLIRDFLFWTLKGFVYCKMSKSIELNEANDLQAFFSKLIMQDVSENSDIYTYCQKQYHIIKIKIDEKKHTTEAGK